MVDVRKYIVFSPYFGKLPVNFDLWLESCAYNKDFKFVVFTDDCTKYNLPKNVEMVHMTFTEFRKKMQSKFNFEISLKRPYKLCDFKPTYGYVFAEYIEGYDYWGYCDLDLIFGDIKKFLRNKIYDKISYQGHFCLYRNSKEINEAFMDENSHSISYKEILSHSENFAFDENNNYGINGVFERNNFAVFDFSDFVADIYCGKKKMCCRKKTQHGVKSKMLARAVNDDVLFIFRSGRVYLYDLKTEREGGEYAYVHFQKRKMSNDVKNKSNFLIVYDRFVDYPSSNKEMRNFSPGNKIDFTWFRIKAKTAPKRIKRELAVAKLKRRKGGKR